MEPLFVYILHFIDPYAKAPITANKIGSPITKKRERATRKKQRILPNIRGFRPILLIIIFSCTPPFIRCDTSRSFSAAFIPSYRKSQLV